MPYIIDAHQDLAYNAFTYGRDYLRSAVETRQVESDTPIPQRTGHTTLGWPEFQRGQVAAIFGTLFLAPKRYQGGSWETQAFADAREARTLYERQLNYYRRLTDEHSDQFRLIHNKADLQSVLEPWEKEPAYLPLPAQPDQPALETEPDPREPITHPTGLVLLMEGAEGLRAPEELEEWWEMGVRIVGPVWAGTRFCGGSYEPGEFTSEGFALLEVMASLGFILDVSHMTEASILQALDRYEGPIIASHANVRALVKGRNKERHLTDLVIRRLVERDAVIGIIPFNVFLHPTWSRGDDRQTVTLRTMAAHIDYVCQIAGDDRHVGIGTDFDGGFGWPDIPYEINTIADLQKLAPVLAEYGHAEEGDRGHLWQKLARPPRKELTRAMSTPQTPASPAPASSSTSGAPPAVESPTRPIRYWQRRARAGLLLTLIGFLVFLLGARPGMFNIDRSPIIGFVQIAVFLVGLAIICIGGYISLTSLWRENPTSIAADVGLRLVATGYVIAVFAGMADIFGIGSHPLPKLPFFGPLQARGVEIGQAIIALGFLLLLPFKQKSKE